MPRAIWNDTIVAESDEFELVEGNVYFPPSAINAEYFQATDKSTHCYWKGDASYYSLCVEGKLNENAAWCYKTPYKKAAYIAGYIAFWNGVTIVP